MNFSPVAMHIPDGFLSILVSSVLWIVTIVVISIALRRVNIGEHQIPLMGVMAAVIFACQMLNFTVASGTSGHLMGAAISMILLGPWAAILVMTTVVGIQAIIFQDGGLLALGANIFNMGIVGVSVSYCVFRIVQKFSFGKKRGVFIGGFFAAWFSVEIAALSVALQLALSGTSPANLAVPAMGGIHVLIGIGEGLITVGALAFIFSNRPDLLETDIRSENTSGLIWLVGLMIAILLVILSPLASAYPDGLEWFAEQKGFLDFTDKPVFTVIPDYLFPGISNKTIATIIAGIIGTLIVFNVAFGVAYFRRKQHQS